MTFAQWLKTKEGFNSKTHYNNWLSNLSYEDKRQTDLYYREKYQYYLESIKNIEFDLN